MDLEKVYEEKLIKTIEQLNKNRKNLIQRLLLLIFLIIFFVFFLFLSATITFLPPFDLFIVFIILLIIVSYRYIRMHSEYKLNFKNKVVRDVIKLIDNSLTYEPEKYITKEVFNKSKIFQPIIDRYEGSDLIHGKIGKTAIMLSQIKAEKTESRSNSDGDTETEWVTIFQGVFFVADFHKHFRTKVILLPPFKFPYLNKIHRIKLEDPEFEKYFKVYGEDQIETRYIISTSLMNRLVELRKRWGKDIYISFVDSLMFIALTSIDRFFDPPLKRDIDYETIKKIFEDFKFFYEIVDNLNLNLRIWSKQ